MKVAFYFFAFNVLLFFVFFKDDRINNMTLFCFNTRKKKLSKGCEAGSSQPKFI